ncbi:Glutamyl-tRNA(Gln) amidotransferase subunit A [Symmachiella dynata]|uniref:Glutamyl-tRNA(Gln) amidotransferase subunit A n=1 Tax=Symmachiella dynata TaxID=2527995 RepID=A0A517ZV40_9PLAN|nr:amidase [Symmachiella dynata]QDU46354.1 Glutamyl-tRNA(Gln) amidotransferase subunit A [Symmachiella dynata]
MIFQPPHVIEIATAVRERRTLAREIIDEALSRISRFQEPFHLFTAILPELARQQAKAVDARVLKGDDLPLAGVPFAVKDLIDVAGVPTTCGSQAFANHKAAADATVVKKLVDAGAVLLGKLNMHECAFGFTGENAIYGNCPNPWNTERIAGGSSSGSAVAVSLGICGFTLGSDTGGSIRMPAALCNLVGLKPTYGRVSRAGVIPLSWSMDHIGPLARTAEETAVVLGAMAGADGLDESSSSSGVPDYSAELGQEIRGLKIGVPRNWFFDSLQPQVAQAVTTAIDRMTALGAKRVKATLPHLPEVLGAHRAIILSEAASAFEPYLRDRPEDFSVDIRTLLQGGQFIPAVDYLKAQRVRRIVRRDWAKEFARFDCLATPTSATVATSYGQSKVKLPGGDTPLLNAYLDMTMPFNLSGQPALTVPCGFSDDDLPIGLQLVGAPFREAMLLRVAHQYQQETAWHHRQPPLG